MPSGTAVQFTVGAKPANLDRFEEVRGAGRVMQANEAAGKLVVVRG